MRGDGRGFRRAISDHRRHPAALLRVRPMVVRPFRRRHRRRRHFRVQRSLDAAAFPQRRWGDQIDGNADYLFKDTSLPHLHSGVEHEWNETLHWFVSDKSWLTE